jgi:hypothetical protein
MRHRPELYVSHTFKCLKHLTIVRIVHLGKKVVIKNHVEREEKGMRTSVLPNAPVA